MHPYATELCDDLDNDCTKKLDEGCDDGDGWCDQAKIVPSGKKPQVCPSGGEDCNDTNAKVSPGQKETCADFIDDDCSGEPDDGCALTVIGFSGGFGPNWQTEGFLQCGGWLDKANSEEVPTAWGVKCVASQWNRIRIACGASAKSLRWIEVKKNVFKDGIENKAEIGLITSASFDLQGNNLIKGDDFSPNVARMWWVSAAGCGEGFHNLTVNNPSCPFEASNCFGQNLGSSRFLYVYVGL